MGLGCFFPRRLYDQLKRNRKNLMAERIKSVFGKLYNYIDNLQSKKNKTTNIKRNIEELIKNLTHFYGRLLVESDFIKNLSQEWKEIPTSSEDLSNLLLKNFNNLKLKTDLKEFRQLLGFIEFLLYTSLKQAETLKQISQALELKGLTIDQILTDYEKTFEETKEKVIEFVKVDGISLESVDDQWKDDIDVVIEAVKVDPIALVYASNKMKKNKTVVLEAVQRDGLVLEHTDAFKDDKEVILVAVKNNGLALKYSSEELRKDRELVKEAVMKNGGALGYASDELKKDKEIVKAAVKNDGMSLYFADEDFKSDRDIVKYAVRNSGESLQYASKELKEDRPLVIDAMKQNLNSLRFVSDKMKNHYEIKRIQYELKNKK